jgi:hypothetical protein
VITSQSLTSLVALLRLLQLKVVREAKEQLLLLTPL